MKISTIKLPGLYDLFYVIFWLISAVLFLVKNLLSKNILHNTNSDLTNLISNLWFLPIIGIIIAIISFYRAIFQRLIEFTDLINIGIFILLKFAPGYSGYYMIILTICAMIFQRYARKYQG